MSQLTFPMATTIERAREAMLLPLLVTVKQSDPVANRVMYRLRYVHEVR